MKYLLVIWATFFLVGGCKKAKEDILEERALNLLHGTEWKIVTFTQGSSDISADFSTYVFRFDKDGTMAALRNNNTEATGTWQGDIEDKTMYAHFPAASHPLFLLNATWTITQSTSSALTANTKAGTEVRQLKMEKL